MILGVAMLTAFSGCGGDATTTDVVQFGIAEVIDAEAERILRLLLAELPVKQAAALAARITGAKKSQLYKLALSGSPSRR